MENNNLINNGHQTLNSNLQKRDNEKSFIDKLLAREEVEHLRQLIKKENLTRSELLDILYNIGSVESKLANYNNWDRYLLLKFHVWIRDFVQKAEHLYDFMEKHEQNNYNNLTERTIKNLKLCKNLMEHMIKFLVDLYLNISRTTLSLGGSAFFESLNNRFEYVYADQQRNIQPVEKKGFFNRFQK